MYILARRRDTIRTGLTGAALHHKAIAVAQCYAPRSDGEVVRNGNSAPERSGPTCRLRGKLGPCWTIGTLPVLEGRMAHDSTRSSETYPIIVRCRLVTVWSCPGAADVGLCITAAGPAATVVVYG